MQPFLLVRDANGNTLLEERPIDAIGAPESVNAHIADDGTTVVVTITLEG